MATKVAGVRPGLREEALLRKSDTALYYAVPVGRVLFSAIFILSSVSHFTRQTIQYGASQGVPWASVLIPLSGIMAFVGGVSVLLGYKARFGALLLVLFLIPVTFAMHAFWTVTDPTMRMIQEVMFLKNLSMLGGALVIAYFGSGPISLDVRSDRSRT